jgi:diadenosine tetraphosphate (Ap4A) HIT family hydrolase
LAALLNLRIKIRDVLKEAFGAQGFHYAWNEEKIGGQSVPHFHLHVVPRKEGDMGITEYEPRKFLYRPGSREEKPDEELKMIAQAITTKLKD